MTTQEILNQLLNNEEWFLNVTSTGRAEISTAPAGVVVGKIECHQPEKNSLGDLIITVPMKTPVSDLPRCEPQPSNCP